MNIQTRILLGGLLGLCAGNVRAHGDALLACSSAEHPRRASYSVEVHRFGSGADVRFYAVEIAITWRPDGFQRALALGEGAVTSNGNSDLELRILTSEVEGQTWRLTTERRRDGGLSGTLLVRGPDGRAMMDSVPLYCIFAIVGG